MAKIGDLGIARQDTQDQGTLSMVLKGTPAYLDPLYVDTYKYTKASDVYSFGLVLLQVVCGAEDVDKAKHVAMQIDLDGTSAEAAGQLLLDKRMPGNVPPQAL